VTKYKYPDWRYGEDWNRKRQAIFRECEYRCFLCERYSKNDLHLHHIVPISISRNNSRGNLVCLCSKCHKYVHSGKYKGPLLNIG